MDSIGFIRVTWPPVLSYLDARGVIDINGGGTLIRTETKRVRAVCADRYTMPRLIGHLFLPSPKTLLALASIFAFSPALSLPAFSI